jgi:hypothetical protein
VYRAGDDRNRTPQTVPDYGKNFIAVLLRHFQVEKDNIHVPHIYQRLLNRAGILNSEWGITNWFPRVFNSGWKYWAIVMPDKVVGQMNMKRFIDNYAQQGLAIQIFDDPDEALKWLESV